jgi:AIPR protein
MKHDNEQIVKGTQLLIRNLEDLQDENPELGDFHSAFEFYCMNKYSLGSKATTSRTGGKKDLGIDFFSARDKAYHVAQCKIPAQDWLEANTRQIRLFGPATITDPSDALRYLLGESTVTPNDRVKYLFTLVDSDRQQEDFSLVFFLIVYGQLNPRALDAWNDLKSKYESKQVKLVLQQIEDLVDEFLLGASRSNTNIDFELRIDSSRVLHAPDYCYCLVNGADIFKAFQEFGWRLFDLNLRYEIRNSPVNGDIVDSLKYQKTRRKFHHYNNGLIIVTNHYALRDKNGQIKVSGAQVVNGLQTIKSIYNAVSSKEVSVEDLDKDCRVQVKVISTQDPDFVTTVVQSTNNQNPMSPRNLKSNNREQKLLRTSFASFTPRWFFQVKEGEWESVTQEAGRFFKQIYGFPPMEFKPDPQRKRGRILDNQDAAKVWLAFIGFADLAGDRVTHYFAENQLYEMAFSMRPSLGHWLKFAEAIDFNEGRQDTLEKHQGDASQYLLAFFLWQFGRNFIPAPQKYREEGLEEGVKSGKITKSSGSITSSTGEQEAYLSENGTYQTWRLMSNMKELLVECGSQILARKYGHLGSEVCLKLLNSVDGSDFLTTADVKDVARGAAYATDVRRDAIFSRIFGFMKYAAGQFWEERRKTLLATSRLRTALLRRDMAADFKRKIWELNERKALEKTWKWEGVTFLESLPPLN